MPTRRPAQPRSARHRPDTDRSAFARLNTVSTRLNLAGLACSIVYWGLNPDRCNDTSSHSHSFYEACYVFAGAGSVRVEGRTHALSQGQIFILRPNQTHRIRSSASHPMGIYFWAFTLDADPGSASNFPDLHTLATAFIRSSKITARPPQNTFEPILALLKSEAQARPPVPGFAFAVAALTRKLILETFRAFASSTTPPGRVLEASSKTPVARALLFIHDNFMRPITVGQIAQHVHLGERQLGRLFLQVQSMSVAKYLANIRIEAAGRMLLAGGLSIKEIAARCGYPDVAYFTAVFKKSTRLTPGEYRGLKGSVYPLRVKK